VTGLITAIPVAVVFAGGLLLHNPRAAITMAVGANLVAIVSLVGAPKLPLRIAVLDAVALGVSVFVSTLSASQSWLHALLLVPWCFVAGMAVVFGQTQAVLGSQAIVAYVVLGRFSGSAATALHLGLLVTLGAAVEVGALLVLRLPPTLRYQRAMVATALDSLAHYATAGAGESAFGVLSHIDAAQRVLGPTSLFGRSDDRDLRAIIDQARRARLDLTTLAGLRTRLGALDPNLLDDVENALRVVAEEVDHLSLAIRQHHRAQGWAPRTDRLREITDRLEERIDTGDVPGDVATLTAQVVAHLDALGGQVRSVAHLVDREATGSQGGAWRLDVRWGGLDPARLRDNLALFRENLRRDSVAFRHAVRLVAAVLIATGLAQWLDLPRGYWVAFAVAVILKPDYSTLLRRGVGRVVGTALGASLAAIAVSELHPNYVFTTVLVALVAVVAYASWPASFSVAIGLVTSLVLIMLSVDTPNSVGTALDRLIDVVLGAIIATATYLVWPSSPVRDVRRAEADMFGALARYVDEVVRFSFGGAVDALSVSTRSRLAHFRYASAEAAVGRSLEEPVATRSDPRVERGLLSNGLRILRATHALRFEAERGATSPASPAIDELRRTLVASLDALGEEASTPLTISPRAAYRAAREDFARLGTPASISLNLDELVNAIDTSAQLIND
jgi:uncharacterized membrane protein YccC